MSAKFHYDTITEAIAELRNQGFIHDFNIFDGGLGIGEKIFKPEELEIVDLYRYEGDSDPADESSVFALNAPGGIKGIFITGYGPNATDQLEDLIKLLHFKYKK